MRIDALIVDDEPGARETLDLMLAKYCPEVEVIGYAGNIIEARKLMTRLDLQLVFLDINMPRGSGLELLTEIQYSDIEVILTTAYDQYILQALRLSALDYVLKPINTDELVNAIDRYKDKINKPQRRDIATFNNLLTEFRDSKIPIHGTDGILFLEVEQILYVSSERNYCRFHLQDQSSHVVSKPMLEYEEILTSQGFLKVHKSSIVNTRHIASYKRGRGGQVILTNGVAIDVSRNRKEELLQKLGG